MRAAIVLGRSLFVAWMAGTLPLTQKPEPLRKTDLIRLLTGGTMSSSEIADLVKRNCVSFTPTPRDRENLKALGADSTLLARIDACLRARTTPPPAPLAARPAPSTPVVASPAGLFAVPLVSQLSVPAGGTAEIGVALKRGNRAIAGTRLVLRGSAGGAAGRGAARDAEAVTDSRGIALFRFGVGDLPGLHPLTVAAAGGEVVTSVAEIELAIVPAAAPTAVRSLPPAATAHPAAARTGFALGSGQRGVVGQPAILPLIFETRDSQGNPIAGFPVQWAITNGRLVGAAPVTDSAGQARAEVVFGKRSAPTVVTGTAGGIIRQATLYANPGRPARLVVERGGVPLDRQLVVSTEGTTLLRVYCRDGYDNPLPLAGLVAAAGDEGIVRVTAVTSDSAGGWITIRPGKEGITNLTVQGSGVRADLSAMVRH